MSILSQFGHISTVIAYEGDGYILDSRKKWQQYSRGSLERLNRTRSFYIR